MKVDVFKTVEGAIEFRNNGHLIFDITPAEFPKRSVAGWSGHLAAKRWATVDVIAAFQELTK